MKKFIIKQELRIMEMADRAKRYGKDKASQAMELIADKRGAGPTTMEILGWGLLSLVVIAILALLIIGAIKDDFWPMIANKIIGLGDLK